MADKTIQEELADRRSELTEIRAAEKAAIAEAEQAQRDQAAARDLKYVERDISKATKARDAALANLKKSSASSTKPASSSSTSDGAGSTTTTTKTSKDSSASIGSASATGKEN